MSSPTTTTMPMMITGNSAASTRSAFPSTRALEVRKVPPQHSMDGRPGARAAQPRDRRPSPELDGDRRPGVAVVVPGGHRPVAASAAVERPAGQAEPTREPLLERDALG